MGSAKTVALLDTPSVGLVILVEGNEIERFEEDPPNNEDVNRDLIGKES